MGKTIKFPVANVGEIAPGTSKLFPYSVTGGIAYNDHGTIKAYRNVCTHAGAQLMPRGATFSCSRHDGVFDAATGERLSGQPPEGSKLSPIPLVTEGDKIVALYEMKDEFE